MQMKKFECFIENEWRLLAFFFFFFFLFIFMYIRNALWWNEIKVLMLIYTEKKIYGMSTKAIILARSGKLIDK